MPGAGRSPRSALVTVGTTKFEALIKAVDSEAFAEALASKGYSRLVIQKGAGAYAPRVLVLPASTSGKCRGVDAEYFDFAPSLAQHVADAALVISHAGSGSIFEALSAGKALIVVPNPLLMDNHQAELGRHLAAMGVLACAAPDELVAAVAALDPAKLKPYARGDASGIVAAIDVLTGRPTVGVEVLRKGAPSRLRHSGLAVVHLPSKAEAARCVKQMDGKPLLGRPVTVRLDRFADDATAPAQEQGLPAAAVLGTGEAC